MAFARKHTGLTWIGLHPGIVVTDVVRPLLGKHAWLLPVLKVGQTLVSHSSRYVGWVAAQIMVSSNAEKGRALGATGQRRGPQGTRIGGATYFNSHLEARFARPTAYDKVFQNWLLQSWLLPLIDNGAQ